MNAEEIEKKKAEIKKRKDATCKHYTGAYHEANCKAGVLYREMVGGEDYGWMARLPCIPDSPLNKGPMAKCDKYECKSPAEIIAEELEVMDRSKNFVLALGAIRKDGKNAGTVPCPKCENGTIHYTKAKLNGHIWGKCSTAGCLSWMM